MTMYLSFDELDDPEMDVSTARIVGGRFEMDGWIDSRGLLNANIRKRGKHRLVLSAGSVQSFGVLDEAGAGVLIPEQIDIDERRALIAGVIPVALTLNTERRTEVLFEVDEAPFEIRRGTKWVAA